MDGIAILNQDGNEVVIVADVKISGLEVVAELVPFHKYVKTLGFYNRSERCKEIVEEIFDAIRLGKHFYKMPAE